MSDVPFVRVGIFERIAAERKRQLAKFPHEAEDTDAVSLAILVEEVGEVARALNDDDTGEHLDEELVQVAAVAVKWLERRLTA